MYIKLSLFFVSLQNYCLEEGVTKHVRMGKVSFNRFNRRHKDPNVEGTCSEILGTEFDLLM